MSLDLIMKAESTGLETDDECVELANFYFTSGLYLSSGAPGRFIRDIAAALLSGELESEVEPAFELEAWA